MNQTMNDLALLSIGAGVGLFSALIAIMVYVLFTTSRKMQHSIGVFIQTVPALRDSISNSIDKLRGEVSVGLSRLDAERLYSTSLALQRLVKSLSIQVDTMQKALFVQPAGPAIDFTAGGMTEEAEDDARMLADRARWNATQGGAQAGPSDPLAGLSEEDKSRRVLEYFERQRAARAGYPYPASQSVPPSTPPVAGSGIYSSLLDEASQHPLPSPAPTDFAGLDLEDSAELTGKGELG